MANIYSRHKQNESAHREEAHESMRRTKLFLLLEKHGLSVSISSCFFRNYLSEWIWKTIG